MKERTLISLKITDTMDQWMYFLKKSEIKDEFTAKVLEEAKRVLTYENMSREDQIAYKRHIENNRIELSVIETVAFKTERKTRIEMAMTLLEAGSNKDFIATVTKLTLDEIDSLEQGEDIDRNTDDD